MGFCDEVSSDELDSNTENTILVSCSTDDNVLSEVLIGIVENKKERSDIIFSNRIQDLNPGLSGKSTENIGEGNANVHMCDSLPAVSPGSNNTSHKTGDNTSDTSDFDIGCFPSLTRDSDLSTDTSLPSRHTDSSKVSAPSNYCSDSNSLSSGYTDSERTGSSIATNTTFPSSQVHPTHCNGELPFLSVSREPGTDTSNLNDKTSLNDCYLDIDCISISSQSKGTPIFCEPRVSSKSANYNCISSGSSSDTGVTVSDDSEVDIVQCNLNERFVTEYDRRHND